jgi:hypothetical protein
MTEIEINSVPEIMEEFLGRTIFITELISGVETKITDSDALRLVTQYMGVHYVIEGVKRSGIFQAFQVHNGERYLDAQDWVNFCELLGITTVPFITINESPLFNIQAVLSPDRWEALCKELQPQLAEYHQDPQYIHKGIIIRPIVECHSFVLGGRLSIKVLNPEYKHGK